MGCVAWQGGPREGKERERSGEGLCESWFRSGLLGGLADWESRRGPAELISGSGRWVTPSRWLGCWQAKRARQEVGKGVEVGGFAVLRQAPVTPS